MSNPLKPLRVEITWGEQVQVKELADPREVFCQEFNAMCRELGGHARACEDITRVILKDPDDPNFFEAVGGPVSREVADLAKQLYDEATAKLESCLEMVVL